MAMPGGTFSGRRLPGRDSTSDGSICSTFSLGLDSTPVPSRREIDGENGKARTFRELCRQFKALAALYSFSGKAH